MIASGRVIPRLRGVCNFGDMANRLPKTGNAIEQSVSETANSLRLMASVFEHSSEGIVITDQDNRIVMVNSAFSRLTGYSAKDVLGRDSGLLSAGKTPPEVYREMWRALAERGNWEGELWDRRKSSELYLKQVSIVAVRDGHGHLTHYVTFFNDITARKEQEQRMAFLAHHDDLTRLPNRLNLLERLDDTIRFAKRNGKRVALMLIDLDRFKAINDTQGHLAGDRLLIEVASRLRLALRESDIVARLAGDEFVVVITEMGSVDYAAAVADKIVQVVSAPHRIGDRELATSPSIGICVYPDDATEIGDLMANADAAMYCAKAKGTGKFQFFKKASDEGTGRHGGCSAPIGSWEATLCPTGPSSEVLATPAG
jgi:diguanylate cyclase (GGDEF)-like protein/PAS domain S-box-containing protein